MIKHRFFVGFPLVTGQTSALDKQVSQHINSVLRLGKDQLITLFNGQGGEYEAQITGLEGKQVLVRIGPVNPVDRESPLNIRAAIALTKGDRMDYAIQKVTEMGASRISPLFTARSEIKLSEDRARKKLAHWQGIITSACEQSGRNLAPCIDAPMPLQQLITSDAAQLKLILCPGAPLLREGESPTHITLLTGPEGGFTDMEIDSAKSHGFQPTGFGPRVMRAETAPLAVMSVLQYVWGDVG